MKSLKSGWLLIRQKSTETFYPFLQKTLARLVIFPDGENLVTKYEREIKGVNLEKHFWVTTTHGQDSFKWQIDTFGAQNMIMHCHVVKGLAPTEGTKDKYVFEIAMPEKGMAGMNLDPQVMNWDYQNAVVTVTENDGSTFIDNNCIHNLSVNHDTSTLKITIYHFSAIDKVDVASKAYVTGNFNITVAVPFVMHAS